MMLMRPSGFFCYILCLLLESYMSLCVIAFMNESYESCLRVCVSCMRGPCTRARSHVREHVLTYESKISLYDDAATSQLHMLRPRYATHRLMYESKRSLYDEAEATQRSYDPISTIFEIAKNLALQQGEGVAVRVADVEQ